MHDDLRERNLDAFVVDTTGGTHALVLTELLRTNGFSADRAYENRSMKSQMKAADRSGARHAIIVGSDEASAGTVVLRPLREEGEQITISREELLSTLKKVQS